MALGIFAGTGFEVEAAGGLYYEEFTPQTTSYDDLLDKRLYQMELTCSEILQIDDSNRTYPKGVIVDISYDENGVRIIDNTDGKIVGRPTGENAYNGTDYETLKSKYSNTKWYITKRNPSVSGGFVEISEATEIDNLENFAPDAPFSVVMDKGIFNSCSKDAVFVLGLWKNKVMFMTYSDNPYTNAFGYDTLSDSLKNGWKQALTEGKQIYIWKSDKPATSETTSQGDHTHSYSWVTVQEATTEQDGIKEYCCTCGDVQERSVIPASAAIADGFCNAIGNAPLNGIAEYDSGWWYTMSDYFIRELAKRPDVTTVITFKYQNQYYKMTIPAGTDYTQLLADEEYFYGYFYFAGLTGARIEAVE